MGSKLGQVGGNDRVRARRRAEKSARERAGESAENNSSEKHNGKATRWRQHPRPPSPEKPGSPQPQGHPLASALQAPEPCEPDQRNTTAARWRQRQMPPNSPSPEKPGSSQSQGHPLASALQAPEPPLSHGSSGTVKLFDGGQRAAVARDEDAGAGQRGRDVEWRTRRTDRTATLDDDVPMTRCGRLPLGLGAAAGQWISPRPR
ncbi:hypothetical protein HPB47_005779 [Ixodes persulcatus]|uniref:Uncharacterized protein n=1 Tax=Ixodes persulcatus TaxID=34615 RepID=A0AC60PBZ9_IXOPE|nr:hypothetical protein HPB47_005779 [Ixodes persulcatus]